MDRNREMEDPHTDIIISNTLKYKDHLPHKRLINSQQFNRKILIVKGWMLNGSFYLV